MNYFEILCITLGSRLGVQPYTTNSDVIPDEPERAIRNLSFRRAPNPISRTSRCTALPLYLLPTAFYAGTSATILLKDLS